MGIEIGPGITIGGQITFGGGPTLPLIVTEQYGYQIVTEPASGSDNITEE